LGGKDSKAVVQPVVEKECTWTGFYIGGHGGYAWGGGTTFRELGQTDPGYDFDTREIGDNGRFHADDSEVMGLIGFGLEYAFNCHWSVRVEYNHLFASDNNDVTGVETDPPDRFDTTFRVRRDDWNLVTAGLNFKF